MHIKKTGRSIGMLLISLFFIGCEEQLDCPSPQPERSRLEVPVCIALDLPSDASALSEPLDVSSGRKAADDAFSSRLSPSPLRTKTGTSLVPDQLYNLEIQQYDQAGQRIGGMSEAVTQAVGSQLTLSLAADPDCQLVAVAWGEGNTTRLGTSTLSEVQKKAVLPADRIAGLDPAVQSDMNKMPYVLHLPHASVTSNGTSGRIGSLNGAEQDVRLQLQRLAVRLELVWSYRVADYTLNQILLQSIPLHYNVVAKPDAGAGNTYPSLLDQFTTLRLDAADLARGYYACWLPANVRGTNPAATSLSYRTKQHAPIGSSYASFVAVNTADAKKKLDYRLYLGGPSSADFNLNGHTDYKYTIDFSHAGLPVNDKRVTIIDPVPASENNDNRVPTANCFMVAPGGAFCFDPFTYRQEGADIENATLKSWSDAEGGIASVRLVWQTKENGDVGDPVIGMVNAADDHTNIVEIKRLDGTAVSTVSPLTESNQGLIYCRVAANTTGGSGLIAAYTAKGEIIWSWHIWVTDYNPDAKGNATVLTPPAKRKQKYVGNGAADQLPMMDRNLGAMMGFVTLPTDAVEMSKACGFHYQGGRKDPFPSSYSSDIIYSVDFSASDQTPPKGMLNQYGPDGITYFPHQGSSGKGDYRALYKNPYLLYGSVTGTSWSATLKTVHDPCPAGWRIPSQENYRALFEGDYLSTQNVSSRFRAKGVTIDMQTYLKAGRGNGYLLYYDEAGNVSYFRMSGYPPFYYQFRYIGECGNLWVREPSRGFTYGCNVTDRASISYCIGTSWGMSDAHTTRCIQEQP